MNRLRILSLCLLLLLPGWASAARLDKPYQVEVPVPSQALQDRTAGTLVGLQVLIQRLTGQSVAGNARVEAAAAQMDRYLLQFGYQSGATVGTYLLQLEFSPPAIQQLIQESGLSLWPLDRPAVLLLVTDGQGEAALPGLDVNQLARLGRERGVPLRFASPEQPDLDWASVRALDSTNLLALASREGADAILLGHIRGDDQQGWGGNWLLHYNEHDYRFAPSAPGLPALLDAVMQETARYLSGSYRSSSTADSGPASLRLQIDNIQHYAAYSQLQAYLGHLDVVQRSTLVNVNGSTMVVDVEVKGRESFRSLMALFRQLRWVEERLPPAPPVTAGAAPTAPPGKPVWVYQWAN